MANCSVCMMDIDEETARFKLELSGKIYYFCSSMCMESFKKDPGRYITWEPTSEAIDK